MTVSATAGILAPGATAAVTVSINIPYVNTLSGFGSRVAGYPGDNVKSAAYVEEQFRAILGPSGNVSVDPFDVSIPYDASVQDGPVLRT